LLISILIGRLKVRRARTAEEPPLQVPIESLVIKKGGSDRSMFSQRNPPHRRWICYSVTA
jgi:hypothetical protein